MIIESEINHQNLPQLSVATALEIGLYALYLTHHPTMSTTATQMSWLKEARTQQDKIFKDQQAGPLLAHVQIALNSTKNFLSDPTHSITVYGTKNELVDTYLWELVDTLLEDANNQSSSKQKGYHFISEPTEMNTVPGRDLKLVSSLL